jgi:hypothetical protein
MPYDEHLNRYYRYTANRLEAITNTKNCGDCLRWLSNKCPHENVKPSMYDSACDKFTPNESYNAACEVLVMKKLES